MRWIPPVHSPIATSDLIRGAAAAAGFPGKTGRAGLEQVLLHNYSARGVLLCDSGTSALVAAFQIVAKGAVCRVACPAYVCVDVGAAALAAGVELALYDTDPNTLSPDMDSLERVLGTGCNAVLVAHLFGYPIAIDAVVALCRARGIPLIEDAAQEAGATFGGRRLGSFGDLTVVSFGRGKGVTGGGGGALLVAHDAAGIHEAFEASRDSRAGWREWAMTVAQWALGRPSLYGLPLALPGLKLGEMVYKEAHEPRAISHASVAIVIGSLAAQTDEILARRANAAILSNLVSQAKGVRAVAAHPNAQPAFLRFPVVSEGARLANSRRIGALRGYPRLLDEDERLRGTVGRGSETLPGAARLRDRLFTIPTHGMLRATDYVAIRHWLILKRTA